MTVWTIAADVGTKGEELASALASAADVPLLERHALAALAHDLAPDIAEVDELEEIEARLGGPLVALGLNLAISGPATTGALPAEALQEVSLRDMLPDLGRAVLAEAARRPCVILTPAAFAALEGNPTAVHLRLRAPLPFRVSAYQREALIDRHHAERALKHHDRQTRAWIKSLYHADIDDARLFALTVDVSRFTSSRLLDIALAAGGAQIAQPAAG